MLKESKNCHLEFTRILHVPEIWAGMAISPQGMVFELRRYFISIYHVRNHKLNYDHTCYEKKMSYWICRHIERGCDKGGRGRNTSGSSRRVQEMFSIDFSCPKTLAMKERLLWAFYGLIQDIFLRSDGRGHIDKGGHGRITSESGRRVLEMLSIDFSSQITYS